MKKTMLVSPLAILMAVGCSQAAPEESVSDQRAELETRGVDDKVLATLTTSAGTKLMFLEGDQDGVGVAIVGAVGKADADLDAAREGAKQDVVRLYELVAKSAAPAALREAVARASEPRFTADASDEGETQIANAQAASGSLAAPASPAMSPGFCDIYNYAYSGSGAFEYCWPNQYGEPWVKRKGDHMACRFDVVDGPIRVRARYKNASGWHTSIDIWLQDNQFMQFEQDYRWAKRWRECKTVDNPYHRKHHFRVVGHDSLAPLGFNPVDVDFP